MSDLTVVDLQRVVRERVERRGFRVEREDIERGPLGRMVGVVVEFSEPLTKRRWWVTFDRDLVDALEMNRLAVTGLIDREIASVAQ